MPRVHRRPLLPAVLAAAFATGSGQFLGSGHFLQRRGGSHATSSSFTSSFSWFQGRDGQMHQQVEETRTKFVQEGSGVKQTRSKLVCQDGICKEVMEVVEEPQQQAIAGSPRRQRLRDILERIMGRKHQGIMYQPTVYQPAVKPIYAEPLRVAQPRAPKTPESASDVPLAALFGLFVDANKVPIAALFCFLLACSVVTTVVKCRRSDAREAARERPLRALAQPLAPDGESDLECGGAVREAKGASLVASASGQASAEVNMAASMYLSRLYARIESAAVKRAVPKYLSGLYARVVA